MSSIKINLRIVVFIVLIKTFYLAFFYDKFEPVTHNLRSAILHCFSKSLLPAAFVETYHQLRLHSPRPGELLYNIKIVKDESGFNLTELFYYLLR